MKQATKQARTRLPLWNQSSLYSVMEESRPARKSPRRQRVMCALARVPCEMRRSMRASKPLSRADRVRSIDTTDLTWIDRHPSNGIRSKEPMAYGRWAIGDLG